MSKLREFLQWHLENPHNLNFKMIVRHEEREETLKEMQGIVNILDTGLTPDEINALREIDNLVKNKFSGALTMKEIIGSFCEFYDANSDGERVAKAKLLTNGSVGKWEELNERDTAKEPEVHINSDEIKVGSLVIGKGVKAYSCPKCSNILRGSDNFCPECGQRLKRED